MFIQYHFTQVHVMFLTRETIEKRLHISERKRFFFFFLRFGIEGICKSAVTVILWFMRRVFEVLTLRFESKRKSIKIPNTGKR